MLIERSLLRSPNYSNPPNEVNMDLPVMPIVLHRTLSLIRSRRPDNDMCSYGPINPCTRTLRMNYPSYGLHKPCVEIWCLRNVVNILNINSATFLVIEINGKQQPNSTALPTNVSNMTRQNQCFKRQYTV